MSWRLFFCKKKSNEAWAIISNWVQQGSIDPQQDTFFSISHVLQALQQPFNFLISEN